MILATNRCKSTCEATVLLNSYRQHKTHWWHQIQADYSYSTTTTFRRMHSTSFTAGVSCTNFGFIGFHTTSLWITGLCIERYYYESPSLVPVLSTIIRFCWSLQKKYQCTRAVDSFQIHVPLSCHSATYVPVCNSTLPQTQYCNTGLSIPTYPRTHAHTPHTQINPHPPHPPMCTSPHAYQWREILTTGPVHLCLPLVQPSWRKNSSKSLVLLRQHDQYL